MADSWTQIDGLTMDWSSAQTLSGISFHYAFETLRRALLERYLVVGVNLPQYVNLINLLHFYPDYADGDGGWVTYYNPFRQIYDALYSICQYFIDTRNWVDGQPDMSNFTGHTYWNISSLMTYAFGAAYVQPTRIQDVNGAWFIGMKKAIQQLHTINHSPTTIAKYATASGQGDHGQYQRNDGLLAEERLPRGGLNHAWTSSLGDFTDVAGGTQAYVYAIKSAMHREDPVSYYGHHVSGVEFGDWNSGNPIYEWAIWDVRWANGKLLAYYSDTPAARPYASTITRLAKRYTTTSQIGETYVETPSGNYWQAIYGETRVPISGYGQIKNQVDTNTISTPWAISTQTLNANDSTAFTNIVDTPVNSLSPQTPEDLQATLSCTDQEYFNTAKTAYQFGDPGDGNLPASVRQSSVISLSYAGYRKFSGFNFA